MFAPNNCYHCILAARKSLCDSFSDFRQAKAIIRDAGLEQAEQAIFFPYDLYSGVSLQAFYNGKHSVNVEHVIPKVMLKPIQKSTRAGTPSSGKITGTPKSTRAGTPSSKRTDILKSTRAGTPSSKRTDILKSTNADMPCQNRYDMTGETNPHNLFVTFPFLNTLRKNCVFGIISKQTNNVIICNKNNIFIPELNISKKKKQILEEIKQFNENANRKTQFNVFRDIKKFDSTISNPDYSTYITAVSKDNTLCTELGSSCMGECIIEPSNKYKGLIARIILFHYLLYYSKHDEWKYYEMNMNIYYEWATDYAKYGPISKEEHVRNKLMFERFNSINIFVGYYNNGQYIPTTNEALKTMLQHLFNLGHKSIITSVLGIPEVADCLLHRNLAVSVRKRGSFENKRKYYKYKTLYLSLKKLIS